MRGSPTTTTKSGTQRMFFRSIRLERDFHDSRALEGYSPTPQVRQVLSRIAESLQPSSTERAWTLTGPYGTGKSAFALFLAHLLSSPNKKRDLAWPILSATAPKLADSLESTLEGRQLLPVVLTLRRAPLVRTMLEGLQGAVGRLPNTSTSAALARGIRADLRLDSHDSRGVLGRIESLIEIAGSSRSHRGILLIMDELGKALEYAARTPGEDIYLLQELAELASRSGAQPLLLVGVLHQAFEQYGEHLNASSRKEWAKVQGRFADIVFLEPPEQQMRLAAAAAAALGIRDSSDLSHQLRRIAEALVHVGYAPNGIRPSELVQIATQAYPLHPTALIALPYLFRRFAQNERSLYAYILSQEPYGLQDVLKRGTGLVRLPDLFDYFMANLAGSLVQKSFARRWLEVSDALERTKDLSGLEEKVLKTIGLLGILGDVSHLKASYGLIALALADSSTDDSVRSAVDSLATRSLVVYRRYNNTYRVWEGSDVDIDARLEEGRYKASGTPLGEILARYLRRRPIVARQHSYEYGALRFFELKHLDEPSSPAALCAGAAADGVVACCLPTSPDHTRAFEEWARSTDARQEKRLVIVIPEQLGTIREAAGSLAALHWVWENTPELRDDRVASRELAERTLLVERSLGRALDGLLDPRPEPSGSGARWYHQGNSQRAIRTPRNAAHALSQAMDVIYPECPKIQNELISRRDLSSAAAAARRNLVERMLTRSSEALLGIDGFPPERSMYESVLLSSGLHSSANGSWAFGQPPDNHPLRLRPAWNAMAQRVFSACSEPIAMPELFADLVAPPFGVMPGILPVLLTAFLLTYPDETSLYRDGSFVPEPAIADLEVLMRRPELFAVAGVRVTGERQAVVDRMAAGLQVKPAVLPIVRSLLHRVKCLPDSAWRTRELPDDALSLRNAFEHAKSPEKLLFLDIPAALGLTPLSNLPSVEPHSVGVFFDRLNAALDNWVDHGPRTVSESREYLLSACGLPQGDGGWRELQRVAHALEGKPIAAPLVPFINRLSGLADDAAALDGVLALIAGKPVRTWNDADADRFRARATEIGALFVCARQMSVVLTADEDRQRTMITSRLREELGPEVPVHVLRAALAELLQELQPDS